MLSLFFVFFYLLFCSIFGVQAMPTGSYQFKRHEHLHTRVHSFRLSRPIKMDEPVQSPSSWSESRLEEGLLYRDVDSAKGHLLEDDARFDSLHDQLSAPY
ncbi:hypothetical protein V8C37DRAFT_388088 [Trichoderma ceciliae]